MQQSTHLRLVEPGGQVQEIPLAPGVTTIGESADNHIVLAGPRIASRHVQLLCDAQGCRLVDLGSATGTRVNGRPVPPNLARRLQPGDVIEIGEYRLHYEAASDPVDDQLSPAPQDTQPAIEKLEVPRMRGRYRRQKVVLWIIGALGVVAAVGLVALLAWIFLFSPRAKGTTPTPFPTAILATATSVAEAATDTPAPASPTATLAPQDTATATATEPLLVPVDTKTPEPTVGAEAVTSTVEPTETSTTAPPTVQPTLGPTYQPTVQPTVVAPLPTWTPAPVVATATPSPWGMVNAATANVRSGPSSQYPVITQVFYGQYVLLLGQSASYDWLYLQLQDGRLGWMAAYLVTRSPGLALPIVPAPPLPPTAVPPTWTPAPPLPTWTPVPPLPTWTPVPPPTWTPLPPPTWTPVPPPCPIAIGAPFVSSWTGTVADTLRCPVDTMKETWTAIQPFERGVMLWREDQRMIYVIANDNTWRKIADNWVEGMPAESCPGAAPAGLVKPIRGFGYVWCNTAGIQDLVGWATADERGYDTQFQAFEGGEMMRAENNSIYILLHSGWWQSYP